MPFYFQRLMYSSYYLHFHPICDKRFDQQHHLTKHRNEARAMMTNGHRTWLTTDPKRMGLIIGVDESRLCNRSYPILGAVITPSLLVDPCGGPGKQKSSTLTGGCSFHRGMNKSRLCWRSCLAPAWQTQVCLSRTQAEPGVSTAGTQTRPREYGRDCSSGAKRSPMGSRQRGR